VDGRVVVSDVVRGEDGSEMPKHVEATIHN
jgi:hypothetical protein